MVRFDPEKFAEKYRHYLTPLQRAYRIAFDEMNARYDSRLVHALDQQVLNESEPVYADGAFAIELPPDPYARLTGVEIDQERFETVIAAYTDALVAALEEVFEFPPEPKR
jgi:hypothetical protein